MFCKKCMENITNDANFCSNCGTPLTEDFKSFNVKTGAASINIGVGNLPNSNIHIGDKIIQDDPPIIYEMNKTSNFKLPIKASWATIAGIVGFIGSLASIYSVLSGGALKSTLQSNWFFLFMVLSMCFFFIGIMLLKSKFVWLQFFGFDLDEHGYIRLIRLKGKCPLCTGDLSVHYSGPEGASSIVALCSRNPEQHRFTFDPTWLDNI